MAKIKISMQIDESMKDYVEEQSERLGVSQSGFINMCIASYKEQRESIQALNNMKGLANQIEELNKNIKKIQK
jgi:antitoxin component of RelBE/YafQ-DinJ toxin-antitoxin module